MTTKTLKLLTAAMVALLALLPSACQKNGNENKAQMSSDDARNAQASYVAPGQKDEYYLFYSGGHSGQVFVAGIPSMRHIATIPVFAPYSGTG